MLFFYSLHFNYQEAAAGFSDLSSVLSHYIRGFVFVTCSPQDNEKLTCKGKSITKLCDLQRQRILLQRDGKGKHCHR